MTYSKAAKLLNVTPTNTIEQNAKIALTRLRTLASNAPLRYKVACQVLINEVK